MNRNDETTNILGAVVAFVLVIALTLWISGLLSR